nr:MFS transporter [Streptomyces sp. alain-838]
MTSRTTPARRQGRKVLLSSLIGSTIEWYEFFVYGTAASLVFSDLFFPSADPLTGTLLSLSTFAIAFVARPVGGAIFGHFGDRLGRKSMLVLALTLIGGATYAIGLLPTYEQIGIGAPLLLVLVCLVQGLSLGGEYGGAVLMSVEHAEPHTCTGRSSTPVSAGACCSPTSCSSPSRSCPTARSAAGAGASRSCSAPCSWRSACSSG